MKYIDTDRLREELQKTKTELKVGNYYLDNSEQAVGYENALIDFESLIDSIKQEQPELPKIERAEYYYHKGVYEGLSQGRADALKILDEFMKRQANPVIVIKQQEQPEVDLEKEYKEYVEDDPVFSKLTNRNVGFAIARHFYELGQIEMRHRITNPEYNAKVVEQLKSEYPASKED